MFWFRNAEMLPDFVCTQFVADRARPVLPEASAQSSESELKALAAAASLSFHHRFSRNYFTAHNMTQFSPDAPFPVATPWYRQTMASSSRQRRRAACRGMGNMVCMPVVCACVRDPFEVLREVGWLVGTLSVIQINAMGPKNWIFQKWSIDTFDVRRVMLKGLRSTFPLWGEEHAQAMWKTVNFNELSLSIDRIWHGKLGKRVIVWWNSSPTRWNLGFRHAIGWEFGSHYVKLFEMRYIKVI